MIIHKVRAPFLCREGQFTPNTRDLCVGLDYNTIKKTKTFWCYLGNNKKKTYEIDSTKALEVGQTWKNPKGKTVIIVPISAFTVKESKFDKEAYDKKEAEREQINSEILHKAEQKKLL